jgi:uncharacterized protein YciI
MFLVVIGRDKPDMTEVRARTRPHHLEYMAAPHPQVRHVIGAPLASDDGAIMMGTLYMLEAPDKAVAETYARNDPYARAGIFATLEVITIHPAGAPAIERIPPKATA